tara:strand:- start:1154 stop:1321 length:168 start_codon:yes stop_codon:yes gene_type:complete
MLVVATTRQTTSGINNTLLSSFLSLFFFQFIATIIKKNNLPKYGENRGQKYIYSH